MQLTSPSFKSMQPIPRQHTCEGGDVIPELRVQGTPEGTVALALIVDDPDAPRGTFDHWIAWNIDPKATVINSTTKIPLQGRNGFGDTRYRGPCPPPGKPHRYFFKIYALDAQLSLPEGSSKAQVLKAMEGHILDQAELVGTYQR